MAESHTELRTGVLILCNRLTLQEVIWFNVSITNIAGFLKLQETWLTIMFVLSKASKVRLNIKLKSQINQSLL